MPTGQYAEILTSMWRCNHVEPEALPLPCRPPACPVADPAVKTIGLVRRYGSVTAVDGIDLEVPEGEIYGFLGPNGAGKSTFIRVLCTLLHPTSGTAMVAGYDVVSHPQEVRLRIGVALQDAALDDRQTGRELLDPPGPALRAQVLRDPRRASSRSCDLVDIGSSIDRLVGTYSGGMKRRLDLAAALVHNPEILFLDEPTTGLDPASREAVWAEVQQAQLRARHDHLPHHPVSRRGRRARANGSGSSPGAVSWPRAHPTSSSDRSART